MENGQKISGTIEVVAKTNGIKIDGEWYNPHGKAKEYVKPEMKGKEVELTMTGHKNDFSFIKILGEGEPSTTPTKEPVQGFMSSDDYWRNKEARDITKSDQISRHGSINTAVEIFGPLKTGATTKEMNAYLLKATVLGDLIKRYADGDKSLQQELVDRMSTTDKDSIEEVALEDLE